MDAAVLESPEDALGLETRDTRTVSAVFADFTLGLTLDAVPAELVVKAKRHMLDGLGIALASTGFDYAGPTLQGARNSGSEARRSRSAWARPCRRRARRW